MDPLAERAAETRVGFFASEESHDVTVRFTNGAPVSEPDAKAAPRGIGIKIHGVPGAKLLPGDETSTDFDLSGNAISFFVASDVATYNLFQRSIPAYVLRHPLTAAKGGLAIRKPIDSPLSPRYFSISTFRFGSTAAKFVFEPCEVRSPRVFDVNDAHYLRAALREETSEGEACLRVGVQIQRDPVAQPVEDLTVEREEEHTPFLPIATLEFPKQDVGSSEETCSRMDINPWRVPLEHRPLGGLNRVRGALYRATALKKLEDERKIKPQL